MIFIENKYTRCYYNIIANAQARNLPPDVYIEKHHILPKSLGGVNSKDNLIKLTAREHYICHLLLTKMTEGDNRYKMWYAHYMMMRGIKRYKPSARMYQLAKRNLILANKERPSTKLGVPLSKEHKEKISKSLKGKSTGPKSEEHKAKLGQYVRTDEHKKAIAQTRKFQIGKYNHSEETKKKIAESNRGKSMPPKTIEQKKHLSAMMKGRKCSEEHRQKIAEANRRRGPSSEETKQKIREARAKQVMKPRSDETKQKISESHKARRLNTL